MIRHSFSKCHLLIFCFSIVHGTTHAQGKSSETPEQMFARPLYTKDLPADVATIKVIGEGFSDVKKDHPVTLYEKAGNSLKQFASSKTGEDGRARFHGLQPNKTYVAKTTIGKREVQSAPFDGGGVRLLFSGAVSHPRPNVLSPHTIPHIANEQQHGAAMLAPDDHLNPGQINVFVFKGNKDHPVENTKVIFKSAKSEKPYTTNSEGKISVETDLNARDAQFVVVHDEMTYESGVFRPAGPNQKHGLRATFIVWDKTANAGVLTLGKGTHILAKIGEKGIGFLHKFHIQNQSGKIFNPNPKDFFIPLPSGAQRPRIHRPQEAIMNQPIFELSKNGQSLRLTSPLPPGELTVQVSYEMSYEGSSLSFIQPLVMDSPETIMALSPITTTDVVGPSIQTQNQDDKNDHAVVYVLEGGEKGGRIEFTFTGLPTKPFWPTYMTFAIAGLICLWGIFAFSAANPQKTAFHRERQTLLREIVNLRKNRKSDAMSPKTFESEHHRAMTRLREIWPR